MNDDRTPPTEETRRTIPVTEDRPEPDDGTEATDGVEAAADPPLSDDRHDEASRGEAAEPQTEVEILRGELARAERELDEARTEAAEFRDRWLRARADLENVRRRGAGEVERAREAGLDSAVLPVLSTYDDLRRALQAAEDADPATLVPGIKAVLESLERSLAALDIERVGEVGDAFDPDVHEALTAMPTDDANRKGTIAQVYEAGFTRGDRLVRPARVVVYADD